MYPGSFNPPTVAHLAIAEAAVQAHGLARVDGTPLYEDAEPRAGGRPGWCVGPAG